MYIDFSYKNKNISINAELIQEYETKISKFSDRTIEYLLKTNNGTDDMDEKEISSIVNDGIKDEIKFHKEVPQIINTLKYNGDLE